MFKENDIVYCTHMKCPCVVEACLDTGVYYIVRTVGRMNTFKAHFTQLMSREEGIHHLRFEIDRLNEKIKTLESM